MEQFSIKAIVIGVSLFVTMMTLTAILMYYNTAKSIADKVNNRTDIASSFDNIMNSDNFEDTLTGVEVRSLINKYAGKENVEINVITKELIQYNNVNNRLLDEGGWYIATNEYAGRGIISEEKLSIINPSWKCKVDKVENLNKTTLNISLNVNN